MVALSFIFMLKLLSLDSLKGLFCSFNSEGICAQGERLTLNNYQKEQVV